MSKKRSVIESISAILNKKSGLSDVEFDSSPAFGTNNSLNLAIQEAFSEDIFKLCQETVPDKFPYKEAKLVHHDYDMSKRWYVDCHAWDVSINKLRRYRLFEPLNRIKAKGRRIMTGEQMVLMINGQLRAGKVLGKDKLNDAVAIRTDTLTLLEAIKYVWDEKKRNGHRENYYRTFQTLKTMLEEWLEFKKAPDFYLKKFTQQDARDFFLYLRTERKLANKTINTTFDNLGIAFRYIEKHSSKLWRKDPLGAIDTLPVIVKKHAAFSERQVKVIMKGIDERVKNAIKELTANGYLQLKLFIQFIYYTLARPKEIYSLRVGDIDLKGNRVFIRGEESKNKIDEYVPLPNALQNYIRKSGVMKYPPEDYLFSKGGLPGKTKLHENFFWDKHNRVLKEKGLHDLNLDFSLYSYKHTGAISLYTATKDIKLLQRQCRHQSVAQTDAYLRDLGAFSTYEALKGWKGAV